MDFLWTASPDSLPSTHLHFGHLFLQPLQLSPVPLVGSLAVLGGRALLLELRAGGLEPHLCLLDLRARRAQFVLTG